jgi:hypothetical protein
MRREKTGLVYIIPYNLGWFCAVRDSGIDGVLLQTLYTV